MYEVTVAVERHNAAAAEYATARSAYEDAVMSGGDRPVAQARLDAAASVYVETLAAVGEARKAVIPEFEALLGDPTMQVDQDSVILAGVFKEV